MTAKQIKNRAPDRSATEQRIGRPGNVRVAVLLELASLLLWLAQFHKSSTSKIAYHVAFT